MLTADPPPGYALKTILSKDRTIVAVAFAALTATALAILKMKSHCKFECEQQTTVKSERSLTNSPTYLINYR